MYKHLNVRVDYNDIDFSNLIMPENDKKNLKGLAAIVREIAERPEMIEKKRLWHRHNNLQGERPMILCDPENGWHEIIPESTLECANDMARHWELTMKKQIFWGDEMQDDYVVEPVFDVPHVYKELPWRIRGKEGLSHAFSTQADGGAYHIETVMNSYDELPDVLPQEITVDYETSGKVLDIAHEVFDGILKVQNQTVWFWSFGLTDEFSQLRGMNNLFMDFYDNPEGVHALMKKLKEGTIQRLEFLEKNNLFYPNNNYTYVGSGGVGFTDQLPSEKPAKMSGMWGMAESQITVGVSPDMFAEFIYPYQKEIMDKFGLNCYGCCEGMETRMSIVKQSENLRRVSVSHWADPEKMSDELKKDYIFSMKPSPTPLAFHEMDMVSAREELEYKFGIAKDKNCVEIIMKDNHTLGNNPENVKKWVALAREITG
ncbi:MAG: hypothetical protein JEY99_02895 [Spirochaetales bacterium]|nr:hypothetical protein [Spirochaetales bacterium]